MSYMALYRKFRPQTFEQVKGQDHVVRTLKNQIKTDRIGHAYLFTGTRGTGKTSVAKIFARAINCQNPIEGEPCGNCESCRSMAKGSSMDIVEIDAASNNGVDEIRQIVDEVQYTPSNSKYKVYIIDEVHMLSGPAFNAFLKTLEEPPSYVVFILATTEPHKLPITILSRCQRYDFHRISDETITDNLAELIIKEGVEADRNALEYVAKVGDGSMRDSISLLDKCIAFNLGEKLTYENVLQTLGAVDTEIFSKIFRSVHSSDAYTALECLEEAVKSGKDLTQFVSDFTWYIRNILITKINPSSSQKILGVTKDNLKILEEDAQMANAEVLMRYIRVLSKLLNDMKFSATKQIQSEVAFIKLAKPEMESDNASLADRIRQMEKGKVAPAQSAPEIIYEPEVDFVGVPESPSWPEETINYPDPIEPVKAPMPAGSGLVGECWPDIISAVDSQRLRVSLKKTWVSEEEGEAVVIATNADVYAASVSEGVVELKEAIKKVTGKDVSVTVRIESGETKKIQTEIARPATQQIDVLKNINFNIETEDF